MGVMRFVVHPTDLLGQWPEAYRAYISGLDGRVYPTRVEFDGNVMTCRRHSSESGKLHVAWPVNGFGRPVVTSTSLPERDQPFLLAVELARGKISQVRDQLGAWEIAGMVVPDEFQPIHREAHRLFARATACQDRPEEASELASAALEKACRAAEILSQAYTAQRLQVRRRRSPRLPAALSCNLGEFVPEESLTERYRQAFTAAAIPVEWRKIEPEEGQYNWDVFDAQVDWCEKHRLMMFGGPLLDLSPDGMPGWLWQWEHDFLNMQSFVCDFVETAVTRYVGKIRCWEVSARVNTGGALALTEENRLALVARTLEIARQVDAEIQLMVNIDQPWGGYQARGQHRLSPLQFADALVRSGIGLSAINLEVGFGYRPSGSPPRDLLDLSQLIDHWTCLGIPLHITLAFPSCSGRDDHATSDLEVDVDQWKQPWSEEAQANWIDQFLPMLMAKQIVVGIHWCQFSDGSPHHFPHAGLVRPDGTPKPALDRIIRYCSEYWNNGKPG